MTADEIQRQLRQLQGNDWLEFVSDHREQITSLSHAPSWEDKLWGRVQHLFVSPLVAISYLEVRAGKRCSIHYHEHRANLFHVVSGALAVHQIGAPNHILYPGEQVVVPINRPHWFRVLETGTVVELYWSQDGGPVSSGDIVRFDAGGDDNDISDDKLQEAEKWAKERQAR